MTDKKRMEEALNIGRDIVKGLEQLEKEGVVSKGFVFRIALLLSWKQGMWCRRNFGLDAASAYMKEIKAKKALSGRK